MQFRKLATTVAPGVLLAAVTYTWADYFAFGKSLTVPEWARPLPFPECLPTYVAALALAAAAALPRSVSHALKASALAVAVGPLGAVFALWELWASSKYLLLNAAFTFGWVLVVHIVPAAVVLLALRIALASCRRS